MKEVGKFEAAEEQLITAIDLFFRNKSEIFVHTLAREVSLLIFSRGVKRKKNYQYISFSVKKC
jgi:hypothetical protein